VRAISQSLFKPLRYKALYKVSEIAHPWLIYKPEIMQKLLFGIIVNRITDRQLFMAYGIIKKLTPFAFIVFGYVNSVRLLRMLIS
jgi:hypothetical protein